MNGPYKDRIFSIPKRDASTDRIQDHRNTRNRKTPDHANATQKCMNMPSAVVLAPPFRASVPTSTAATPWNSRATVELYAATFKMLEKSPSMMPVNSPVRTRRSTRSRVSDGYASVSAIDDSFSFEATFI